MQQNALDLLLDAVDGLLVENNFDEAARILREFDQTNDLDISEDVSKAMGAYNSAKREYKIEQTLKYDEFVIHENKARRALQAIATNIPEAIRLKGMVAGLNAYQFSVPEPARLEKIIGPKNNLLKINWLEKALAASKAVCRVVCADGELGTGFVTKEGYLITNNHVIPDAKIAKEARIEFNYQMDASGKVMSRTSYQLDASDFKTSTPDLLDFAKVKIIDNPSTPLKQWGFLELDPTAIPTVGEAVTIIQHPKGEDKQIALNANDVLGVWNQHIFYTTDTEPGSSGSPVFNSDWKVVAIHHAGKTDAEGGLQVNAKGDRKGANRGILIGHIMAELAGKPKPIGTTAVAGKESTEGLQSFDGQGVSNPVVTPVTTTPVTPVAPVVEPKPEPAAPAQPPLPAQPHLVVLYDAADADAAKMLKKHLTGLTMSKKITLYNVHLALAGEDILARAEAEIARANILILLMSSNLFNDDAIWLGKAEEAISQKRRLIPVRVDDVDMSSFEVGKLRPIPTNKTITQVTRETSADAAWKGVADEITAVLKR
jgi:V8-like Glu-specific endopeptidase